MAAKLRKGDQVMVTAGKDLGRRGTISTVLPRKRKAIVEGINDAVIHQKQGPSGEAGRFTRSMPIDLSNLMLVDPESGKPTRVGFRFEDGRKVRFAKKSGVRIDD